MLKHFKFDLHEKIRITELQWNGTIFAIFFAETGIQYKVRYFWNGEAKEVYFFENELESIKKSAAVNSES